MDKLNGFLRRLRWETGFYLGCLRLQERLAAAGVPLCRPEPAPPGAELIAEDLVCLPLAVRDGRAPVPLDLPGPSVPLAVITGANSGGKTTSLRALGCAQLLLQEGMLVPATRFRSSLAPAVHSHFRRAEDDEPGTGKLAEELTRMSAIVDRYRPGDLLLMNESFSSTDEVQAAFIAGDIVDALLRHGVRVLMVTHFHRLAGQFLDHPGAVFLRAERLPDGTRSHRLVPGRPEPTSHALDVYRTVVEPAASVVAATTGGVR